MPPKGMRRDLVPCERSPVHATQDRGTHVSSYRHVFIQMTATGDHLGHGNSRCSPNLDLEMPESGAQDSLRHSMKPGERDTVGGTNRGSLGDLQDQGHRDGSCGAGEQHWTERLEPQDQGEPTRTRGSMLSGAPEQREWEEGLGWGCPSRTVSPPSMDASNRNCSSREAGGSYLHTGHTFGRRLG